MKNRQLYLAAYDISQTKRLRLFLNLLREYSTITQKSVFECWLSQAEKKQLLERVCELIDIEEDRFILFLLHPQQSVITMGKALAPVDKNIIILL